jgi:hypothetical protein
LTPESLKLTPESLILTPESSKLTPESETDSGVSYTWRPSCEPLVESGQRKEEQQDKVVGKSQQDVESASQSIVIRNNGHFQNALMG